MHAKVWSHRSCQSIKVASVICQAIAAAGAITLLALVPGIATILRPLTKYNNEDKRGKRVIANHIYQVVWRLKKRGVIQQDSDGKLSLTLQGEKILVHYQLRDIRPKRPKRWDKKWRLVAFDVWENRRTARNYLRHALQTFGFLRLQESIWAYPYDCEEFIALLRTDLHLSPAIQYMVVERLDRDRWLRKHFHLPLR